MKAISIINIHMKWFGTRTNACIPSEFTSHLHLKTKLSISEAVACVLLPSDIIKEHMCDARETEKKEKRSISR